MICFTDAYRTSRHVSKVPAEVRRLVSKRLELTLLLPDASLPQPVDKVVELPTKLRIT
jgi:hypothetical protein